MVKILIFSLSLLLSLAEAKSLDNTKLHTVPQGEKWVMTDIRKLDCRVCTADIYIQDGSVQVNGVWISGNFNFSVAKNTSVIFGSDVVFALGDVVESIEIQEKSQ